MDVKGAAASESSVVEYRRRAFREVAQQTQARTQAQTRAKTRPELGPKPRQETAPSVLLSCSRPMDQGSPVQQRAQPTRIGDSHCASHVSEQIFFRRTRELT